MNLQKRFSILPIFLLLGCATMLQAQPFPANPTTPEISAAGASSVNVLPEIIRVVIPLQINGKSMDEALTNLKSERDSAVKKLLDLGFEKDNLTFENVGVDREWESKRRQLEEMINQRIRQPHATPIYIPSDPDVGMLSPITPEPQVVPEAPTVLKQMIFADWPLSGKTQEEILKESDALTQKIKAVDFVPKKEMTPEEEELAEEMAGMADHMFSDESEDSNEPKFVYVAKLSEEQKLDAYKEAFANAKKHAETLVQLTGFRLGMLKQLSGYHHVTQRDQYGYGGNQDYQLIQRMTQSSGQPNPQQPTEGFALSSEPITFTVGIQTVFAIDLFFPGRGIKIEEE